jgi:hypothetical protein
MTARGLRRDAGDMRQLRGREGAAVHQGMQHSGPGRITRDCCDLCKPGIAGHESNPGIESVVDALSYSARGLDVSAVTVTCPNHFRQNGRMRRALQQVDAQRVARIGPHQA